MKKRKLFSLLLATLMVITLGVMFSVSVSAAQDDTCGLHTRGGSAMGSRYCDNLGILGLSDGENGEGDDEEAENENGEGMSLGTALILITVGGTAVLVVCSYLYLKLDEIKRGDWPANKK